MSISRREVLQGFGYGLALAALPTIPQACTDAVLIETGWNTPDSDFLAQHIAEYETQAPWFDGLVVDLVDNGGLGLPVRNTTHHMAWNSWGYGRRINLGTGGSSFNFGQSYQQMLRTPFQHYTHNLFKVTTQYGIANVFEGGYYEQFTIPNMTTIAQIAQAIGCKGIFFDTENYNTAMWSYPYQKAKFPNTGTFAQYQDRYFLLGQQIMQAWHQGFPGLDVLLSWGYYISAVSTLPLEQQNYGLLPSFLDGALTVGPLYDGYEHAYAFRTPGQFTESVATFAQSSWAHDNYFPSFGLWLDYNRRWDPVDITKNWFSPAQLASSMIYAKNATQRYVWVYSEKPNWFNGTMPQVYTDAMRTI
jgi:hypothetical protein